MWKDLHVSLDPTNTHRSWGGTWFLTQLTMVLMVLKMVQVEMVPGSSLQRAAVHGWMPSTAACDSIQSTPSLLDRPVSQSTMRECLEHIALLDTLCVQYCNTVCCFQFPSKHSWPIEKVCCLMNCNVLHADWWTTTWIIWSIALNKKNFGQHTLIRPNQILRWNVPHTSPVRDNSMFSSTFASYQNIDTRKSGQLVISILQSDHVDLANIFVGFCK